MQITEQTHEIIATTPAAIQIVERMGRICYKSEDKITADSADKFVRRLIRLGHTSVLEHAHVSVIFITNRGTTHELVRHRVGVAYSQESTRYVNHGGGDIKFIRPIPFTSLKDMDAALCSDENATLAELAWVRAMQFAEESYKNMLSHKVRPEIARGVLPIDLKTEIGVTANFRTWRHIFRSRCTKDAHVQIRRLMQGLLSDLIEMYPAVFDDLMYLLEN